RYLREQNPEELKKKYGFKQFGEDDDDTLEIIAKAKKRLKKGGEADTETMARQIITDWQRGKLKP
ncbi:MAG: GTP-binding protein, partial [Candidatus Diapherotrites archaeon]|nr:GTP-binding protein [Candidatus Diapherotrites archaeon]